MRRVFAGSLFFLALTGFAQMPIFKRYYIADIPGLGWLNQFYTTHFLHYLAAVLFLAAAAYLLTTHAFLARPQRKTSASGRLRGFLLGAITVTGVFLVVRNRLLAPFSPETVILLDLGHLGTVMAFLLAALFCRIFGLPWTIEKPSHPK